MICVTILYSEKLLFLSVMDIAKESEIKQMHLFLGNKYLQMFSDNINAPQQRQYLITLETNSVSAICSC